jgi:hypothetical protein
MDSHHAAHRFIYEGWRVVVHLDGTDVAGDIAGWAELRLGDASRSRIALAGHHRDGASAIGALAKVARAYIDDWRSRPHTGDTGFMSL